MRGLCEKERLNLSLVESRQVGAVLLQQNTSATYSAFRSHRNTRRAQSLHISIDGSLRHLQPLCQFTCRHAPVNLQEQQDGKQSICTHTISSLVPTLPASHQQ